MCGQISPVGMVTSVCTRPHTYTEGQRPHMCEHGDKSSGSPGTVPHHQAARSWSGQRQICRSRPRAFSLSLLLFYFIYIYIFFFISWRLITLQYCSGFCHTLTWISHGYTCISHPNPPSHLPFHPIPLGLSSAPGPSTRLMHPTWAGDLFHPR